MLDLPHPSVADDHVGLAPEDGTDELRDLAPRVLVVAVGVDDDVGSERERGLEAGFERRRESPAPRGALHVLDPVPLRDFRRSVGRAVVDHQDLDLVEALDRAGDLGEGRGKGLGFVEAGDLDH